MTLPQAIVVYPDGTDQPGVKFATANGFVSRVVAAIAQTNIPDAQTVCDLLNREFATGGHNLPAYLKS